MSELRAMLDRLRQAADAFRTVVIESCSLGAVPQSVWFAELRDLERAIGEAGRLPPESEDGTAVIDWASEDGACWRPVDEDRLAGRKAAARGGLRSSNPYLCLSNPRMRERHRMFAWYRGYDEHDLAARGCAFALRGDAPGMPFDMVEVG